MQDDTIPAAVETTWVYFIQVGRTGPVKIGYSTGVGNRMAELQHASPWELVLRRKIRTNDPLKFEAEMHKRFAHLRMRGEWFAHDADLEAFMDSERAEPKKLPVHQRSPRKRTKAQVVGLDAYRQFRRAPHVPKPNILEK